MNLRQRKLGSQGLEMRAIGLGCMGMSQSYGPADETESIATLQHALELGCNFFDTAEGYGPYANEDLIGRAFKDRRDKVIIATKVGFRFENRRQMGAETDSRPDSIRLAVEECLLGKGDFIVPIPGTKRRVYVEENVAAEQIRLNVDELRKLDTALGAGAVSGNRYNDFVMSTIDR